MYANNTLQLSSAMNPELFQWMQRYCRETCGYDASENGQGVHNYDIHFQSPHLLDHLSSDEMLVESEISESDYFISMAESADINERSNNSIFSNRRLIDVDRLRIRFSNLPLIIFLDKTECC